MKIDLEDALKMPSSGKRSEVMFDKSKIFLIFHGNDLSVNIPEHAAGKGFVVKKSSKAEQATDEFSSFIRKNVRCATEIIVPDGFDGEINIIRSLPAGVAAITSTRFIAGRNSRLDIFEQCVSDGEGSFAANETTISAQERSEINHVFVQNYSKRTESIILSKADLRANATLHRVIGSSGSSSSISKRETSLLGEGAESNDVEVFLGSGTQEFDITADVRHVAPRTNGNTIVKGILQDNASALTNGVISIAKGAQKTDSFLAVHTLMLGDGCRSRAVPSLEIEADDVKAGHSSSTSRIDDDMIFYLSSRGIPEEEAKKLIVAGFLSSALEGLPARHSEPVKKIIGEKWKL